MPTATSPKKRSRHSDSSVLRLTPLGGTFLRVSPSLTARSRSLSPRKRLVKQPLHIRMNLTETQMDKITDALTQKVTGSPTRSQARVNATPSSTPRRNKSSTGHHKATRSLGSNGIGIFDNVTSPTFSELMPQCQIDPFSANLADRRNQPPPPPIFVGSARATGSGPRRADMEKVPDIVSPLSPSHQRNSQTASDEFSYYSPAQRESQQPQPLHVRHGQQEDPHHNVNHAVYDAYNNWVLSQHQSIPSESPSAQETPTQRPRRSKSTGDGLRRQDSLYPPQVPGVHRGNPVQSQKSPLFSPLAFYFRTEDRPSVKIGEKTMIGQNGWLERTGVTAEKEKKTPQKKTRILDSIKKIAKDMTEMHYGHRRTDSNPKEASNSSLTISLDAREQSLLYCELEFHVTNTLNEFITAELDRGHLDADKLKKIADQWLQQGRPRVVGFRYDLETQLELISLHANDFAFYGRRQGNPVEISGLLHAMKVNARALRIRTFCQPDSVVAKQLVDSQSLLNMIGAPTAQQIALAEVTQFFKVIIEREMDNRQRRSRDAPNTRATVGDRHRSPQRGPFQEAMPMPGTTGTGQRHM